MSHATNPSTPKVEKTKMPTMDNTEMINGIERQKKKKGFLSTYMGISSQPNARNVTSGLLGGGNVN